MAQEKKNVNSHQFVNLKSIVTFMRLLFLKYLLIKIENYYKINYLKVETYYDIDVVDKKLDKEVIDASQ